MPRKSIDQKDRRITIRISENDLARLEGAAKRREQTVGAVVRSLIRENLTVEARPPQMPTTEQQT